MALDHAVRVPFAFFPRFPPTLVDEPPKAAAWRHEIKFDGYRTQILIEAGRVQRERGKPAMALMADAQGYVGSAFVTLPTAP
jgi:hypothetical protein